MNTETEGITGPAPALPSADALRAYMTAAGWKEREPGGPAGSIWVKGDARIGVPYDDDTLLVPGVVNRLAAAEQREPADVARGIIAVYGPARSAVPREAPVAPPAVPVPDDPSRESASGPESAQERTGTIPSIRPEDIPQEWEDAAVAHYSMHGAGLVRNILAGAYPLIVAAERERIRAELREAIEVALDATIDRCTRCKVCDVQIDATVSTVLAIIGSEEADRA